VCHSRFVRRFRTAAFVRSDVARTPGYLSDIVADAGSYVESNAVACEDAGVAFGFGVVANQRTPVGQSREIFDNSSARRSRHDPSRCARSQ
jgi:hypothetical protein